MLIGVGAPAWGHFCEDEETTVTVQPKWLFVKITGAILRRFGALSGGVAGVERRSESMEYVDGTRHGMVSIGGLYSPVDDGRSLSWTASPSWYTRSASIRSFQLTYLLGSERVKCRKRA